MCNLEGGPLEGEFCGLVEGVGLYPGEDATYPADCNLIGFEQFVGDISESDDESDDHLSCAILCESSTSGELFGFSPSLKYF